MRALFHRSLTVVGYQRFQANVIRLCVSPLMIFLADAYLHALDPFAVRFPASWPVAGVRWYGLSYALGFVIGWGFARWLSHTRRSPLSVAAAGDFLFYVILGVLLGGRLGYALFYDRALFTDFSNAPPYWDLLAINKGGMASHGGMIGVILACWFFARKHKVPIGHLFDLAAFASLPGLCFGRIANFINAELWGKALPLSMQTNSPWWSVKYPQEIVEHWLPVSLDPAKPKLDLIRHIALDFNVSTALPEAGLRQAVAQEASKRLAMLEPLHGLFGDGRDFYDRVIHAATHGNATAIQSIKPLLTAYYPSQIFQAITDGPILMSLLAIIWLRPRKPGTIASWFLIIYGVLRIVTEIFRQPDVGVSLTFGLSQGQLLSCFMIIAGFIGLGMIHRSNSPPLGGFLRPQQPA
jgi:phosphatidylglycerol:prolipoprotein diacylglycerol transferase